MSRAVSARTRTAALTAGQVVFTASQGLVLVAVARLEGGSAVGLYTLALALASPIFLFAQFRLQDVVATDVNDSAVSMRYLGITLVGASVAFVIVLLLAIGWDVAGLAAVAGAVSVGQAAQSVSFLAYGYLQGAGRVTALALSMSLRGVVGVSALTVGLLTSTFLTAVWAMTVVWVAFALADARELLSHRVKGTSWAFAGNLVLVRNLLPLGLATLLVSVNQSVVRLLVESRVGLAALGTFAVAAYVVRLGTLVVRASVQAMSPLLREAVAAGDLLAVRAACVQVAARSALVGLSLTIVLLAVGPALLGWVFGPELRPSRALLGAVGVAGTALLAGMPVTMGLVATRSHLDQLRVMALTLVVVAGSAYLLAGPLGLPGAALGWAVGECVRTLGLFRVLHRLTRRESNHAR